MNESKELFAKLHNEDNTCFFRIKTEWEDGYFRLFIVEDKKSWFALVTKEHIEMLAEQHELAADLYFKNLREYINDNAPSISFNILKKQFIVYRSVEKEKFRIKYFYVDLEELNYQETVQSFIDDLINKYIEIQMKMKIVEEQRIEAESQKLQFERKLGEFVELKQKADLEMYSAFILILNEKKHRIRFLTELLEEYQNDGKEKFSMLASSSTTKKSVNPKLKSEPKPSTSAEKSKEVISDTESDSVDDYNTDDEKQEKSPEDNIAVSGASESNLDFLGGDSPLPPSLPKRIKKDQKKTCSTESFSNDLKQVEQKNGTNVEVMDIQEADSDDDLQKSLNFDTQELLERM